MVSFKEAVDQWKQKYVVDNKTYQIKCFVPSNNSWATAKGIYYGLFAASNVVISESEKHLDRLYGISHKGEMQALYSEGKCIWTKE